MMPENTTPIEAILHVETLGEKLYKTAKKVRSMSLAERQANAAIEHAKELAETGRMGYQEKIMTREFFKANKEALTVPPEKTLDEVVEEMYESQKKSYELLEKQGLKVSYKELDLPSTLDINMDGETRRIVEMEKRFTESVVTVSWDYTPDVDAGKDLPGLAGNGDNIIVAP